VLIKFKHIVFSPETSGMNDMHSTWHGGVDRVNFNIFVLHFLIL